MAGSFFLILAIAFGATYMRAGREVAFKNLRFTALFLLLCFAFPFGVMFLVPAKYGSAVIASLYIVGFSIWLISWFFRKQNAGALLAETGRSSPIKFLFWLGLAWVVFAVLETQSVFTFVSGNEDPEYINRILVQEISWVALSWFLAICMIAFGYNKLELRENGICFIYSLIKWQQIDSYSFHPDQRTDLVIRFEPIFPLAPGFMIIPIPARYRDLVNHILEERLPGKNLVALSRSMA